jgi:predicted nuclease with TOPRIM domain
MRAGKRKAMEAAYAFLALYIERRTGLHFPLRTEELENELHDLQSRREEVRKALEAQRLKLHKLKREIMSVETERSGLHFRSYVLFNDNTTLAIRLSGDRALESDKTPEIVSGSTLDRIMDRYVFRVSRSS